MIIDYFRYNGKSVPSKSHAHLQTLIKTPARFKKDPAKIV